MGYIACNNIDSLIFNLQCEIYSPASKEFQSDIQCCVQWTSPTSQYVMLISLTCVQWH
jgi:hypothetical protein